MASNKLTEYFQEQIERGCKTLFYWTWIPDTDRPGTNRIKLMTTSVEELESFSGSYILEAQERTPTFRQPLKKSMIYNHPGKPSTPVVKQPSNTLPSVVKPVQSTVPVKKPSGWF